MALVRERRHQRALSLSMPSPAPPAEWSPLPSPSSSSSTDQSPGTDSLLELEKLAVLGHSNGGVVYKVCHRRTAFLYALKVLRFDEKAVVIWQQAAQEAVIFKRMDSPLIVKCHGVFSSEGGPDCDGCGLCFVMEYMEAGSLHDILLLHRRLPEPAISGIARRVLEGLHYLYTLQIVHKGEIKIADFGVSGVVLRKLNATASHHDSCMGTCAYMSPKRFDSERWDGNFSDEFAGDICRLDWWCWNATWSFSAD